MATIYIQYVSKDTTTEQIKKLFSKYVNPIHDIRLKDNKAKPPHYWKYAFVDVASKDIQKALQVPLDILGERAESSLTSRRKPSGDVADSDGKSTGSDDLIHPNSILVTELPMDIREDQIRDYFSRFGKVLKVEINASRPQDEKISAVVRFEDNGTFATVCQRVDHIVAGKYVLIRSLDTDSPDPQIMWFDKAIGRLNFILGGGNNRYKTIELLDRLLSAPPRLDTVSEKEVEVYQPDDRNEAKRSALVFQADVCDLDSDFSEEDMNPPTLDILPQHIREAMQKYREDRELRRQSRAISEAEVLVDPTTSSECKSERVNETQRSLRSDEVLVDHECDIQSKIELNKFESVEPIESNQPSLNIVEPKRLSFGRGTGLRLSRASSSSSVTSPSGLPGRGRRSTDSSCSSPFETDHEETPVTALGRKFAGIGRGFRPLGAKVHSHQA